MLPITNESVINRIIYDIDEALSKKISVDVDAFQLLDHALIQRMLKDLDEEDNESIRDIICGKNKKDLYKYLNLTHQSGKPLSEVFPQSLIDELSHTSNAILELNNQVDNLALNLKLSSDKNLALVEEMHILESVQTKHNELMQQKIANLKQEHEISKTKEIKQISDIYKQQIEDYQKQLSDLSAKTNNAVSTNTQAVKDNNMFNIATFSGKLNIAFAVIMSVIIISTVANIALKNKAANSKQKAVENKKLNKKSIKV